MNSQGISSIATCLEGFATPGSAVKTARAARRRMAAGSFRQGLGSVKEVPGQYACQAGQHLCNWHTTPRRVSCACMRVSCAPPAQCVTCLLYFYTPQKADKISEAQLRHNVVASVLAWMIIGQQC